MSLMAQRRGGRTKVPWAHYKAVFLTGVWLHKAEGNLCGLCGAAMDIMAMPRRIDPNTVCEADREAIISTKRSLFGRDVEDVS